MVIKARQKELFILIGCGLVFAVFGWVLFIAPVAGKLRSIELRASAERIKSGLISEVQVYQLKGKTAGDPQEGNITHHDFIAKISTLAREHGLNFDSLVPATEEQGIYTKLTLDLKTRASFPALIKFLDQLEEFRPTVITSQISILSQSAFSERGSTDSFRQVEFTLETYLKKRARGTANVHGN